MVSKAANSFVKLAGRTDPQPNQGRIRVHQDSIIKIIKIDGLILMGGPIDHLCRDRDHRNGEAEDEDMAEVDRRHLLSNK